MVARERLHTAADLLALSRRDDVRRELVRGEIREMTPTGDVHAILAAHIARLIGNHVWEKGPEGYVSGADGGFILATDPDTVRAPDVAYVSRARLPGPLTGGYFPVAPDLAVEVMSPGDTATEIHEKTLEYLRAGTRLVWVVYPKTRTVVTHTPEGARTLDESGTLEGGEVLPGFSLPVRQVFAPLES